MALQGCKVSGEHREFYFYKLDNNSTGELVRRSSLGY